MNLCFRCMEKGSLWRGNESENQTARRWNGEKIDLSDYTWTEDDDIPGQIKFIFQIPELLGKASVRLYLNDGYDAPKETAEEKIDVRSEEYREMIQRSLMNFGNTCRIQRVIEKPETEKKLRLHISADLSRRGREQFRSIQNVTPISPANYFRSALQHRIMSD